MLRSTFGQWNVVGEPFNLNGRKYVRCKCVCGTEKEVRVDQLKRGTSTSCGCLRLEKFITNNTKHGLISRKHAPPEYKVWSCMRSRCMNTSHKWYSDYGGRGITVCDRWNSFANFYADMGPRPSSRHSLDRIDNSKGYCPENCKWSTSLEQGNNTRRNIKVEVKGQTLSLSRWASILGISRSYATRLHKNGKLEQTILERIYCEK